MPPIITLNTNLKTLRFGKDVRGGGDSGQPFIKFPIESATIPATYAELYKQNRISVDFPIRGGAIDFNPTTLTTTIHTAIDKQRIAAFLKSKPRGDVFLQKQVGLQLSNPNIQTGDTVSTLSKQYSIPAILDNTKVYNLGLNTLTAVGLSGLGLHITRHGALPIDLTAKYYSDIVGGEKLLGVDAVQSKNRLLILKNLKLSNSSNAILFPISNINEINRLGISTNRGVLFDYLSGPGSVYGVGKTTIKRYEDTSLAGEKVISKYKGIYNYPKTYEELSAIQKSNINVINNTITPSNVETTFETIYKFNSGANSKSDAINTFKVKMIENDSDPWTDPAVVENKDLIKFGFECLSNDDPGQVAMFLQFRAFLTKGISDNNTAAIESFKYVGRGEDFHVYNGFSRTLSFGFKVVAMSREELKPIYNKLNYLISQTYPDYSNRTGLMRAPIVKVTIGDYIYRMPGMLDHVNITIDNSTPWEINYEGDTTGKVGQLPQYLDVDISFKPIYEELPRRAPMAFTNENNIQFGGVDIGVSSIEGKPTKIIAQGGNIIEKQKVSRFTSFGYVEAKYDHTSKPLEYSQLRSGLPAMNNLSSQIGKVSDPIVSAKSSLKVNKIGKPRGGIVEAGELQSLTFNPNREALWNKP